MTYEEYEDKIDLTKDAPDTEPERQFYFIKKGKMLVSEISEKIGRKLISCTKTFGCQMNLVHEM